MFKDEINDLIVRLLVIANYAKDLHYNCQGDNFYGNHLLSDKIQENMYEYIDQLKEVCLLGRGIKTLHSTEYLEKAVIKLPKDISFSTLRNLLANTLDSIENIENTSKGDENLLGNIAQDLQNSIGLLNIMLGNI